MQINENKVHILNRSSGGSTYATATSMSPTSEAITNALWIFCTLSTNSHILKAQIF